MKICFTGDLADVPACSVFPHASIICALCTTDFSLPTFLSQTNDQENDCTDVFCTERSLIVDVENGQRENGK
jgi:hypothetical protein